MSIYEQTFRISFGLLALFLARGVALAASPSVTAVLSDSQPAVGKMVQLEIKVNGANSANVPETISIDGLEIHQTGQSRQFEMHNFDVTSSVTYNFTILPLKAGQFKIPPQTVRVGNDSLRTPELTLNVTNAPNGRSATVAPASSNAMKPWAQLTLAKSQAYIGQPIEAQIEIGFDARMLVDPQSIQVGPEVVTSGFAVRRAEQFQQTIRIINGIKQRVFMYKAALLPAKSGHFEVPVKLSTQVRVPISRNRTPRSQRRTDPFQELFEDMEEMMPDVDRYGDSIPLDVTSDPVALTVKPLPPNPPPNFSGAVGNFTMTVDAKPKTVQVGDPITVTSTINGRGNFDRMNGPALEEERGWHKYPPSAKFKQDDDVGISGQKTFEMVIAPNEKKSAVPPLVFAYFDPIKEQYATLRSEPVSIQVEGSAAPAPTAAAAPSTAAPSATAATAAATPAAKPQDILYQMNDLGRVRSFAPIYEQRFFWVVQFAPLLLLFAFMGWKIRQAKIDNRDARRVAALQHESAELLRKLRRSELSPQEYFSNASRVVRVKTALARNINPNAVDAETAAKAFGLSENERAQLRTLFERNDELRFSGGGNGAGKISNDERDELLRLLESLHA